MRFEQTVRARQFNNGGASLPRYVRGRRDADPRGADIECAR